MSSHTVLLLVMLTVTGAGAAVTKDPSVKDSPEPLKLSDAHYADLREMIEHFDRKLDDVLCKTEKHLLEVKSDIKEKLNGHSEHQAQQLRSILDDKLEILGLKLNQKVSLNQFNPRETIIMGEHRQLHGENSTQVSPIPLSDLTSSNTLCYSNPDAPTVLAKVIKDRVDRAVQAVVSVTREPVNSCPGAEVGVSYTERDEALASPVPYVTNPGYCEGGWTVFLRRKDGSVNFTRPWVDYENGFGDYQGEFWLGNKLLHNITSQGVYRLRIELEDFSGLLKTADYERFSIGSQEEAYTLRVSGYINGSSAGDGLTSHNNQKFSTYDRDNDSHSSANCANSYKGGWWYQACHHVNPTGLYLLESKSKSDTKGINWTPAFNDRRSFKSITMKIRPAI